MLTTHDMMTTKKATAVAGIDGDDTQMNDITPATTPTTATKKEGKEESRRRFEVELEFVQCLASPSYLNCMLTRNQYNSQEHSNLFTDTFTFSP